MGMDGVGALKPPDCKCKRATAPVYLGTYVHTIHTYIHTHTSGRRYVLDVTLSLSSQLQIQAFEALFTGIVQREAHLSNRVIGVRAL